MTFEEIEERVKNSLEALNAGEELYDWRTTHYNWASWGELQEACYRLSTGEITEADLKEYIRQYKEQSRISFVDFRIKTPEPSPEDFKRLGLLMGCSEGKRLVPPRSEEERKAHRGARVVKALELHMGCKQPISEKLRQQFTWVMIREKDKTPEMLAAQLKLEEYNPYQKRLVPGAIVIVMNHEENKPDSPALEEAKVQAPMFSETGEVDNSSFEARLAPAPVKKKVRKITYSPAIAGLRPEPLAPVIEEAPHELPAEVHEEFAAYCENLYEKAKDH